MFGMKYMCFILLVSAVFSAPVTEEETVMVTQSVHDAKEVVKKTVDKSPEVVEIVESGSDHKTDGSYSFHYRGADGTFREETAVVKNAGTKKEYLEITGAYSYLDVDGKEVVVQYKADDRGFVPVGNHIPDEISVAARENSQLPTQEEYDDDDDDDDDDDENDNKDMALKMPDTKPKVK